MRWCAVQARVSAPESAFNWQHRIIDGGDGSSRVNVINNYYKPGPATHGELRHRICRLQPRWPKDDHPGAGNHVEGRPDITADNWAGGVYFEPEGEQKGVKIPQPTEAESRVREPFPTAIATLETAEEAYEHVLAQAGASLPRRDPVDVRVMESVRTGRPTFQAGIIDSPADVGGWPEYNGSTPADADRDGMPDAWETRHGLDPQDRSDAAKDADRDGYTSLEEYPNDTDPTVFVDYTKPENNRDSLHPSTEAEGLMSGR